MPHGVDQLVLFPSSNFRAATVDTPPVWTTIYNDMKSNGKAIKLAAKRWFAHDDTDRQL